jgi:hypothetical protein
VCSRATGKLNLKLSTFKKIRILILNGVFSESHFQIAMEFIFIQSVQKCINSAFAAQNEKKISLSCAICITLKGTGRQNLVQGRQKIKKGPMNIYGLKFVCSMNTFGVWDLLSLKGATKCQSV